jgi:hypothetical protein
MSDTALPTAATSVTDDGYVSTPPQPYHSHAETGVCRWRFCVKGQRDASRSKLRFSQRATSPHRKFSDDEHWSKIHLTKQGLAICLHRPFAYTDSKRLTICLHRQQETRNLHTQTAITFRAALDQGRGHQWTIQATLHELPTCWRHPTLLFLAPWCCNRTRRAKP